MNLKLMFGIVLVIVSFLIGKITAATFILYIKSPSGRYLSIGIYLASWIMLFIGVYICGVEGAEYVKKIYEYFSYKYYHEHVKRIYKNGRKRFKKQGKTTADKKVR